jgi:hypothetical protein
MIEAITPVQAVQRFKPFKTPKLDCASLVDEPSGSPELIQCSSVQQFNGSNVQLEDFQAVQVV